ncbi:MAG: VOC family protein [Xanthomonadales bacterium]|nr:VOC family protein [Xanthomonadales bacterium]
MGNVIKRTTLIVRDMERSIQWYQAVLGLSIWFDKPFTLSGVGLAAGKAGDVTRLVILQAEHDEIGMIGLLQWVDPPLPAPEIPTGVSYGNPTFVVASDDARECWRQARELGTGIHAEPHEWSTEGADGRIKHFVSVSLFDPDGHFYEINQVLKITDP